MAYGKCAKHNRLDCYDYKCRDNCVYCYGKGYKEEPNYLLGIDIFGAPISLSRTRRNCYHCDGKGYKTK